MDKISAIVVLFCVPALAGCGAARDAPSSTGAASATAVDQELTDFTNIPGQFPTPGSLTANGQAEAPIGGCVNLGGELANSSLTVVDCGSAKNTYRVIKRVNVPQECGDTDRSFYHNSKATGQYAACLDLAWDSSSCIGFGQPVRKVACTDTTVPNRVKPVKVVLNTTTLDGCPDGGYKHPQRRFTVCTETQK